MSMLKELYATPDQSFPFMKEVSCPDTLVLYDLSALEVARKM